MNLAIAAIVPTPATSIKADTTVEHRKLVDAAQQFEGMLLQELLKPMQENGFQQDESDKKDGEGFAETLSTYGTEAMATAIAKRGGLGIARRVIAQVEGEKTLRAAGVATGTLSGIPK